MRKRIQLKRIQGCDAIVQYVPCRSACSTINAVYMVHRRIYGAKREYQINAVTVLFEIREMRKIKFRVNISRLGCNAVHVIHGRSLRRFGQYPAQGNLLVFYPTCNVTRKTKSIASLLKQLFAFILNDSMFAQKISIF